MWLLVALSVGGVAVALERAIHLILTRENVRRLKQQTLRCCGPALNVDPDEDHRPPPTTYSTAIESGGWSG